MNPNECDIMVASILTVDGFNERVVVQKYARDTEWSVPKKTKTDGGKDGWRDGTTLWMQPRK